MVDRSKLMKAAWARYRQVAFKGRPFNAETFAAVLRFEWKKAKADAVYARVQAEDVSTSAAAPVVAASIAKPMSEMERRIDGLKFLSSRYRIDLMEREIRAEYGTA